jgi:flagellar biosynthesis protein FlhF
MLVGPTGAGKTTTIAKLAARAALIENKRVKLLTLDNFRIGGIDQIRTFAELIGVPLEVVERPIDLVDALDPSYDLTLIDTAGRSPRDTAPIAELSQAIRDAQPIEVHLVAPAATSLDALEGLARRYRVLSPSRLCVTKLDEIDDCSHLAKMPTAANLSITWVTTGQAVPEDLEEPSATRLLELSSNRVAA